MSRPEKRDGQADAIRQAFPASGDFMNELDEGTFHFQRRAGL